MHNIMRTTVQCRGKLKTHHYIYYIIYVCIIHILLLL